MNKLDIALIGVFYVWIACKIGGTVKDAWEESEGIEKAALAGLTLTNFIPIQSIALYGYAKHITEREA